jgi:hypothetical protein
MLRPRSAAAAQLPEQGQRKLLDRLAGAAAGGIAPPLVTAALEGMGALVEVLGEVPLDAAAAVEQARLFVFVQHGTRFFDSALQGRGADRGAHESSGLTSHGVFLFQQRPR